jgi:hypothetical protein
MTRGIQRTGLIGGVALAAIVAASLAAVANTGAAPEDDLTVVKRAVAQATAAPAAPPARTAERPAPEEKTAEPRPRAAGKEPTWLKVRVTDKQTGRRKVTVNVPLALVRAVGDDWPRINFDCGERRARCGIKVSEVLAALEAGQDLVEIEEEDESVRVWVE